MMDTVNLDVTALICLVSNLCHGKTHFIFNDGAFNRQATEERLQPVLHATEAFLANKSLIVCKTALRIFSKIMDDLGGEEEKERAYQILENITVVEDEPSVNALSLKPSRKITQKSVIIFGTSETHQAVTLSSNVTFVNAALQQGVKFEVEFHAARALSEKKEKYAQQI